MRDLTGLPVIVKGVLRADDAVACLDAGAAGVVVSNHGGRQLDRAIAPAVALSEVVTRSASRAPVLVDGGIVSGTDVFVALALGASATMVGRPDPLGSRRLPALAGCDASLTATANELDHAMGLAGVSAIGDFSRDLVV